MSVTVAPAREASVAELARLQCAILPDSRMSLLGTAYVEACYRYFLRSPIEFVLAAELEGQVVGGAFVSLSPRSLSCRLIFNTPLLPALLLHPFGQATRRMLGDVVRPEPVPPAIRSLPEMVAIFVAAGQRGGGIGEAICRAAEEELRRRNAAAYAVRTENETGNRALAFYRRLGFVLENGPRYSVSGSGPRFVYLAKSLRSPTSGPIPTGGRLAAIGRDRNGHRRA